MESSSPVTLIDIPLFRGLNDVDRSALATMLTPCTVAAGEMLFHQGDPGDSMYIVSEGEIEIFVKDHSGQKVTLGSYTIGDIFGELSLLDQGPRTASVFAITDTKLFSLARPQLLTFLQGRPDAALSLMQVISQRLRQANQLIQARITKNFNTQIENKLSFVQRSAFKASSMSGSLWFLFLNAIAFTVWILANSGVFPSFTIVDPFPFSALSLFVSLEAIFLSIIVLFAQNLEAATDKIKNDIEYEVNLRAEQEVTHLHEKIDHLRAEILARLGRIELKK